MKPLIGINVDINVADPLEARVGRRYLKAIQLGGGIPLLIPPLPNRDLAGILSTVKGILFIGGLDYSPALYGQTASPAVKELHPDRQEFDLRLARLALKARLPLLAICGGMQLLNIVRGGSLVQDLEDQLPGSGAFHKAPAAPPHRMHAVSLAKGSRLRRIFGSASLDSVLSSHHQAVKQLGRGFRAVAHAGDGVIEAIELSDDDFVVGVQWHPEGTLERSAPLFRAFVKAARSCQR